jgi:hypothetical protein
MNYEVLKELHATVLKMKPTADQIIEQVIDQNRELRPWSAAAHVAFLGRKGSE